MNVLKPHKKLAVLSALLEGCSIRATSNVFSEVLSKALADHLGFAMFLGTIKRAGTSSVGHTRRGRRIRGGSRSGRTSTTH